MSVPPRTTPGLVQGILNRDYDWKKNPSLEPYIQSASMLVDRVVQYSIDHQTGLTGPPLGSVEQEIVERWLAAHFYCMSDITYMSRSTNGASGGFFGTSGLGLDLSRYGQMAKILDTSGALAAFSKAARAGATWLGKNAPQQIPIWER